jgi:FAD/FMN-containing dehydrogenase/Fe-S oxidoreductase
MSALSTKLEKDLKANLSGDVGFDQATKIAYSVDASIFEIEPLGVVAPRTREEVITALEIASAHDVSIIPRGAATGITGGCIGPGLVIDLSRYLNSIIDLDFNAEFAICQPGVVQDDLNRALAKEGYRLGPDTSTGNRATLGGMLANNAAGARSLRYGKMVDHIEAVDLALVDGNQLQLSPIDQQALQQKLLLKGIEGDIYREIEAIRHEEENEIKTHFPKLPRRVSGYNLDELIKPGPLNLSKLIAGSEGTLGIALELKLRIVKKERDTALCIVHFDDLLASVKHLPEMLAFNPLSLEMIDDQIIAMGRRHPATRNKLGWMIGNPAAVVVAEFEEKNAHETTRQLKMFEQTMKQQRIGYGCTVLLDPVEMQHVWEVRKAGLGLLLSKRTYSRAIAFIEDIAIPPEHLEAFMGEFLAYLNSIHKQAGIYGHVGAGCLHIRPYIDLRDSSELALMEKIMRDVADLLLKYGGALSGEHGDGYIRSWLNEKMFGPKLYGAFCRVKNAFDPDNRMNPGKIVHAGKPLQNLREKVASTPVKIETFLDFSREGGLELAADLCNGNGLCRKSEMLMCPSFQATKDECDTTRARAQGLRAIVNGRWPKEELAGESLNRLMDLCLECKGCKTECPSQVDMAKMKAEFLYHYQMKHGTPLRSKIFGHIGQLYNLAAPFASVINNLSSSKAMKWLMGKFGIASERDFPSLTRQRFSKWWKSQPKAQSINGKTVILFNDTYNEFNQPEIGKAAIEVLQALGYNVIVPPWSCCGRPLFSKGMLPQAKNMALKVLETLKPFVDQADAIIGLEPSCLFMLKDDFVGLVSDQNMKTKDLLDKTVSLCTTFDAFVAGHIVEGRLPLPLINMPQNALVHGHCHQKALVGMGDTIKLLSALPGYQASEIPSGCCGMAGSFGYEQEHYSLSLKIANLHLIPAIKMAPDTTEIIASGISCRSQITHVTDRRPLHIAEVVASRLT